MKTYKVKIVNPASDEYEISILVNNVWRIFGTPYAKAKDKIKPFTNKDNAKRAAKMIAEEFGIKLKWEDK